MSIDVELSSIDINQCDAKDSSLKDGRGKNGNSDRTGSTDSVKLVDFLGTHKCKKSTQVRLNTVSDCLFVPRVSLPGDGKKIDPGDEVVSGK